jgi:hypothetical protein
MTTITTRYYSTTAKRRDHIVAVAEGHTNSLTLDIDSEIRFVENHVRAAKALAEELGLTGEWVGQTATHGYRFARPLPPTAPRFSISKETP